MTLSGKQLVIGAAALIVFSFGLAFAILQLTDDDGVRSRLADADRVLECNAWNSGALAAAQARAVQLQTSSADAAVFLDMGISQERRRDMQNFINAQPEVETTIYESQADAYRKFVELFADSRELIEATSAESLPESFRVALRSPDTFDTFSAKVEERPGVAEVRDDRSLRPKGIHFEGPLKVIRDQGYYVDRSGKRIPIPSVCTS